MEFSEAIREVRKQINNDTSLYSVYHAAMACALMDLIPGFKKNSDKRDMVAHAFMSRIFPIDK